MLTRFDTRIQSVLEYSLYLVQQVEGVYIPIHINSEPL